MKFSESHFEEKHTPEVQNKRSSVGSFEKIDKLDELESPEDNVGYSFFPARSQPESKPKVRKAAKENKVAVLKNVPVEEVSLKASRKPSCTKKAFFESEQQVDSFERKVRIEDLSPSTIILHYQKKPASVKESVISADSKTQSYENDVLDLKLKESPTSSENSAEQHSETSFESVPECDFCTGDTCRTDKVPKNSLADKQEQANNSSVDGIASKMDANTEIRVLTLNANEHQDTVLYRVEQNWVVRFRLGPSLLGRKVQLFCNYPQENREFQRIRYYELAWQQDEGCRYSDDTALYTQLLVKISGSFHYYFTYLNQ